MKLKNLFKPVTTRALIIVDVQNDFVDDVWGTLAVPNAKEIIPVINDMANGGAFDLVVATLDWHPKDHKGFKINGGTWPIHCVEKSGGAQLAEDLDRDSIDFLVKKGTLPYTEGYSGFDATNLEEILMDHHVTSVTIVGLATDYCVKATAQDALYYGYDVAVVRGAVRGLAGAQDALEHLHEQGVRVV